MSLFKARDWWSTTSGFEEFHDLGCLGVGNLDNSPSPFGNIVVGSFQGLVRIYEPHPPNFAASHVIIEKQFGQPIIQVALGHFQNAGHLNLALLHPHQLSVHTLVVEDSSETETAYNLLCLYSHHLKRTAYNMTWGPFGSHQNYDQICVQSMDGQLSFFTNESPSFTCFLPEFLLPGPLAYIHQTSCLATVNSAHFLQVFKYQTLSVVGSGTDEEVKPRHSTSGSGRKLSPDWVVNLGEHAIQLQVVRGADGPSQIIVLGERSLFSFTQNGILRFMKKLDFIPSCLSVYRTTPSDNTDNCPSIKTLLSSCSNQLIVLHDSSLIWAASTDHTPVDLAVADFREQEGVIVSLDEQGHLTCSYLGTDPTLFFAANNTSRNTNYQGMERELSDLNKVIRSSSKDGLVVASRDQPKLRLWTDIDPDQVRIVELEDLEFDVVETNSSSAEATTEGKLVKKCIEIKVSMATSSASSLREVTVNISTELPLTTHPSHFTFLEVSSTQLPPPLLVTVVCTPSLLPMSPDLLLSATYKTDDGTMQVVEVKVQLPLHLFAEPVYPEKNAVFKVTIGTSPFEANMSKIFPPQLVLDHAPPQALGLLYLCGQSVTVVASKATERYRLQSSSLPALSTILNWLLKRLEEIFKPQTFSANFAPPLPLNDYFVIIDRHFKLRKNLEQCREWLERHAHQFRAIQKRLLTRFKDKTPVGLAHLDTLLDGTYMQLIALTNKSESLEVELQECSNQLSCTVSLINTLLKLCSQMGEEDFELLKAAHSPMVNSDGDQGWEEIVDAAVTHLLRTTLAKSQKDQQQTSFQSLELPADSHKLKKHIALLCDRITKGYLPTGKKVEATQSLNKPELDVKKPILPPLSHTDGTSNAGNLSGVEEYKKHNQPISHQLSMPTLPEYSSEDCAVMAEEL